MLGASMVIARKRVQAVAEESHTGLHGQQQPAEQIEANHAH